MEATFSESLRSVATRRMEGNTEKSSGLSTYMATSSMIREKVILTERSISRIKGLRGIIMTRRIPTIPIAITVAPFNKPVDPLPLPVWRLALFALSMIHLRF